jgi:hypothetical protein
MQLWAGASRIEVGDDETLQQMLGILGPHAERVSLMVRSDLATESEGGPTIVRDGWGEGADTTAGQVQAVVRARATEASRAPVAMAADARSGRAGPRPDPARARKVPGARPSAAATAILVAEGLRSSGRDVGAGQCRAPAAHTSGGPSRPNRLFGAPRGRSPLSRRMTAAHVAVQASRPKSRAEIRAAAAPANVCVAA